MPIVISDHQFARAVNLIDAGDADGLRSWLKVHPDLVAKRVPLSQNDAGDFFSNPKLLWFVAENPVRNDKLPANIAAVAMIIVEAARRAGTDGLQADLDYTLSLVASGRVVREAGVQEQLVETLTHAGADANGAVTAALGHREVAAAECLARCGAGMTVQLASGLGRTDVLELLASKANQVALQQALTLAAINGEAVAVEILLCHGADAVRFNPEHLHAHATPLHLAIDAGSLATVKVLIAGGADPSLRDKLANSDALGWARHFGHEDIVAWLEEHRTR